MLISHEAEAPPQTALVDRVDNAQSQQPRVSHMPRWTRGAARLWFPPCRRHTGFGSTTAFVIKSVIKSKIPAKEPAYGGFIPHQIFGTEKRCRFNGPFSNPSFPFNEDISY